MTTPIVCVDAPTVIIGSSIPPVVVVKLRATIIPLVAIELQATSVKESTPVEVLSPRLQLAIAYDRAKKNMSLSMEEHVFIEVLVIHCNTLILRKF
jgi:hypothetical protein